MQTLQKISLSCKKIEMIIMATIVSVMAVLLFVNVFSRFVLNDSIKFAEEVGANLFVALTYLGSPYCVRKCKHIRMSALIEKMPKHIAKKYSIVLDCLTGLIFIIFGVMLCGYVVSTYRFGAVTAALRFPRWICILPVPIGCFATGLQYLLLTLMNITDKETYWIGTERRFGENDEEVDD